MLIISALCLVCLLLQMFWIAMSDLPKSSVVRFLQRLSGNTISPHKETDTAGERDRDRDRGLPDEVFYWKNTSASLGQVVIADLPASLQATSSTSGPAGPPGMAADTQLIHLSDQHTVYLPRFSSLDVMRSKLKFFVDNML